MAIIIPVIVGAVAASSAVAAGIVVAGGVGAALISTGASLLTGALLNAAGINLSATKKAEKQQQQALPDASSYSMAVENPASDIRNTVRSGVFPQNSIYGKAFVGGVIPWWWISGKRKEFHHFAQVLAAHEIDAVEKFYIGSDEVAVDSEGFVTTKKYMRGKKRLIRFVVYKGDQTALPTELITASEKKMVAGDCATGIAWVYIRWEADYDVFSQVGIPDFRFVVRGKKLYDPRTGTSYYSTNPALAARDYLTSSLGFNCPSVEINDWDVIAAANVCDEFVIVPDGSYQRRYTINGALSCQNGLKDNLDLINFAMSGYMVWIRGQWTMQAGAYQTPVASINQDQIIEVENLTAFTPRRELFNTITGTFIAENDLFVEKQYPIVANQGLIAIDGTSIERNVNFPMVTDAVIAQRLAKIEIIRARQAVTISMLCNFSTYDLKPGSHVYLNIARYGFVNKVFYVIERTLTENGMHYTLRETGPSVWDWTQFEGAAIDPEPNTALPNPYEVSLVENLTAYSGNDTLYIAADGTVLSRIRCRWNETENQYVYSGGYIEFQFAVVGGGWVYARADASEVETFLEPVIDQRWYIINARYVNSSGQRGEWVQIVHYVVGKSEPPPNVANFTIEQNKLNWSPVNNTPDLAGYKIRFQYGKNTWWPTAKPLHEGLLTESPYTFATLPNGPTTILIKAVDTSGNESLVPASITRNTGDLIVNNLLESFVQHPLWLGSKTNCSVVGGELLADDTNEFYFADDLPMYGFDNDLFYDPIQSKAMSYEFTIIATKNSILKIDYLLTTDNFKIEYRLPNQSIFYGIETEKFYGLDGDFIYGIYQDWQIWTGELNIDNLTEVTIRISTAGGLGQDIIKELTAILDVDDIIIQLDNVVISSSGTRLNLGQKVNVIKNIQMTVQADGNNGVNARAVDKNASSGPLVQVLNSSGASVNGLIDAVIQAY